MGDGKAQERSADAQCSLSVVQRLVVDAIRRVQSYRIAEMRSNRAI
jgi:hypothetical protein